MSKLVKKSVKKKKVPDTGLVQDAFLDKSGVLCLLLSPKKGTVKRSSNDKYCWLTSHPKKYVVLRQVIDQTKIDSNKEYEWMQDDNDNRQIVEPGFVFPDSMGEIDFRFNGISYLSGKATRDELLFFSDECIKEAPFVLLFRPIVEEALCVSGLDEFFDIQEDGNKLSLVKKVA